MGYRGNLGCLWLLLFLALVGGTPLLIGVFRLLLFFVLLVAVVGTVGSWYLRRYAVHHYTSTQTERHNRFVELLVALLVRVAESDGELDRREVAAIRTFFQQDLGYTDERLLWVRDLIKDARGSAETVEVLCQRMAADFSFQERFIVWQVLGRVVGADGRVTDTERRLLNEVAARLGLEAFLHGYSGSFGRGTGRPGAGPSAVEDALAELGLARGADAATIKRTWRDLSKQHHPDRVAHLGEEFRRIAEDRMRRINAAYDTLKEAGLAT